MIEEYKNVLVNDLRKEKIEIDKRENEIRAKEKELTDKLFELRRKENLPIRSVNFSFFQRHFTRRKQFKEYQETIMKRSELLEQIDSVKYELEEETEKAEQRISEAGIKQRIHEMEHELNVIRKADTLKDLNVDPEYVIKFLQERGITPVLTEADKVIANNPRDYSSKSKLIGVHKTRFAPDGSIIKTAKDAKVVKIDSFTINGREYSYGFESERNTIHMAMNDEVSSHMFGSWENCKYAILIPFEDIPNEKIGCVAPMDTFTKGSLELTQNCWLLCPKDEVIALKESNPEIKVLGYEGESVLGYSSPFLSSLGYRAEDVGMWSWMDDESAKQFFDLMRKENLEIGTHSYTYFHEDECILTDINKAVAVCRTLGSNRLIKSKEDIKKVNEDLDGQTSSIARTIRALCRKSACIDEGYSEEAIKANHKHIGIFFDRMEENGFEISEAYKTVIRNVDKIGTLALKFSQEAYESAFVIKDECSFDERLTIGTLKYTFDNTPSYDTAKIEDAMADFLAEVSLESVLRARDRVATKKLDGENR